MIAFIDDHGTIHGAESICRTLQVAPSGYYARLAVRADPSKASARQQRGAVLLSKIKKVWNDNWHFYGVRETWRQLCRERGQKVHNDLGKYPSRDHENGRTMLSFGRSSLFQDLVVGGVHIYYGAGMSRCIGLKNAQH